MSNSSKGRKFKPNRTGAKKNLGPNQNLPFNGAAYGNPAMVHTVLSLMGKPCRTKVRNGGTYDGIFHTCNPKMDLALAVVHMSDNSNQTASTNGLDVKAIANGFPKEEELIQEMVFPTGNLVSASFEDVDLNFAVLDANETNGESMSQQRSSAKGGEKKLEPWNGGDSTLGPDALAIGGLESSGLEGTNGWDPAEMFKANKEKYGVVSNYDSSLSSYTMPLEIKATEEDSERVARATRIAQEIEAGSDYKNRINLELDDGVSEEDKFSAVMRDRDPRRDGRGPRDMRERDGEYGGHRGDKDRGDRDHPSSHGYKANKHPDFDQRYRNRGRARDPWRNPQGYSNPNIPPPRSVGPGVGQSGGGGGRNQPPLAQMDGPPGQGGQGKPYRGSGSAHIPPRFTKSGSGGHSRDEERMRQTSDGSSMHPSYQAQKPARPQRMPRSSGGRWPPMATSGEYAHHSPTQMHPDPAVIASGPAGGPLSRTSSSSSNTSAPVQNHRKALSSSSQEEQSQHSGPHHPHIRQTQSSSSPTGGPVIPNSQQAPPRLPGMHSGGPPQPGFMLREVQEFGEPLLLESSLGVWQQKPRTLICPKILKRQSKLTDQAPVEVHAPPKHASPSLKSALKCGVLKKELPEREYTKAQRVRFAPKSPHAKGDLKFDQISSDSGHLEEGLSVPEDVASLDVAENACMPQASYIEQIVPIQPIVSLLNPHQIQPFRLTVAPPCQRTYHHQRTSGLQYLVFRNPAAGVLPDASVIVQTPDTPGVQNSWASAVIRGNQKAHNMGPGAIDMPRPPHVGDISPSGLAHQASGSNKIQFVSVPPNVTLSWTPSPNSRYVQQGMGQPMPGGMNSPRGVHPSTPIQTQMMSRAHPQAQQSVMTSQPQAMPTQQSMQAQYQQQMPMPQRVAQPHVKTQSSAPPEPLKQADKNEDLKPKKPAGPSQAPPISIKSRNEGQSSIKELQEFRDSFKLSTNLKDQSPVSNTPHQRQQPNVGQQQQPSPAASRPQPPYPNPAAQQQPFTHLPQHYSGPYPGAMSHQEHSAPAPHPLVPALTADPNLMQQPNLHLQHVVPHMPHPQMTQIPVASPGIQRFAGPQALMHVSPMGLIDNQNMMGRVDKSAMQMQQKPLTSPKSDISNFNLNGNVHVVTGHPVSQTTPSAVMSVSAAPHVASQYTAAATVHTQMGQQRMKQSPTNVQVLSPSSTPSIEQVGSLASTTTASSASITSPTTGQPLNPDAVEFKPRMPAKPAPVATRAATPLQHPAYVAAAYQPQVISGMAPQSSQLLYNPGQIPQIDPMQASLPQIYPQFSQQFIFGQQQLVQPQMQQFAAFDQNGQVYAGSAPQPMMAQNGRMAALPATPQQHVAQYPLDQSPGTVYVPVPAQQPNFMQQARPHSATPTPTQGSHVTAASPAGQSTQAPQHATQPAPAMVQTPGAQQQQMWMMVQAQHHQHLNQPPHHLAQYINAMPTHMPSTVAMTNVTQQPKGQQQPVQYMGQPPPRQYAQYQSSAPNN